MLLKKDNLKEEIKDILEIVKSCPPNLQEKCFEILLTEALKGTSPSVPPSPTPVPSVGVYSAEVPPEVKKRIRAFAGQNGLTEDQIAKVFAVDDAGTVSIEATDLKVNKTAKKQRRLALLIGIRHQFMEGSFDVPLDELRELCVTYSAYDPANFAANLKNMKELFSGFKAGATNKLSPTGKSEGAALIKELIS
jgi:hypothetical protein